MKIETRGLWSFIPATIWGIGSYVLVKSHPVTPWTGAELIPPPLPSELILLAVVSLLTTATIRGVGQVARTAIWRHWRELAAAATMATGLWLSLVRTGIPDESGYLLFGTGQFWLALVVLNPAQRVPRITRLFDPLRPDTPLLRMLKPALDTLIAQVRDSHHRLIALAGLWGNGKSSLLAHAKHQLTEEGYSVALVSLEGSSMEHVWRSVGEQWLDAELGAGQNSTEQATLAALLSVWGRLGRALRSIVTGVTPEAIARGLTELTKPDAAMTTSGTRALKRVVASPARRVIFVDDADRLAPKDVATWLKSVKAIADKTGTTVVIAIDRDYVRGALLTEFRVQGSDEKTAIELVDRYLQRYVVVGGRLPPMSESDVKQLIERASVRRSLDPRLVEAALNRADLLPMQPRGVLAVMNKTQRAIETGFSTEVAANEQLISLLLFGSICSEQNPSILDYPTTMDRPVSDDVGYFMARAMSAGEGLPKRDGPAPWEGGGLSEPQRNEMGNWLSQLLGASQGWVWREILDGTPSYSRMPPAEVFSLLGDLAGWEPGQDLPKSWELVGVEHRQGPLLHRLRDLLDSMPRPEDQASHLEVVRGFFGVVQLCRALGVPVPLSIRENSRFEEAFLVAMERGVRAQPTERATWMRQLRGLVTHQEGIRGASVVYHFVGEPLWRPQSEALPKWWEEGRLVVQEAVSERLREMASDGAVHIPGDRTIGRLLAELCRVSWKGFSGAGGEPIGKTADADQLGFLIDQVAERLRSLSAHERAKVSEVPVLDELDPGERLPAIAERVEELRSLFPNLSHA